MMEKRSIVRKQRYIVTVWYRGRNEDKVVSQRTYRSHWLANCAEFFANLVCLLRRRQFVEKKVQYIRHPEEEQRQRAPAFQR